VDMNRVNHHGIWHIIKTYSIVNDRITLNITNATINENFNVTIRYLL
jgi:hypothetical protein